MGDLTWTGERLTTSVNNSTKLEHLHRYAFAQSFVQDKVVLDIASGEGYGSNILAQKAKYVYGVDISNDAVRHSLSKYSKSNLSFLEGSVEKIPLDDYTIDIIVSFETLEHLTNHDKMFQEIKRVLRPEGILIISTPDKRIYSDLKNYKNPYHLKELYVDEFKSLVDKYFIQSKLLFQNEFYGSAIINVDEVIALRNFKGDFDHVNEFEANLNSEYVIAIASDVDIPIIFNSIYKEEKFWEFEIFELNKLLISNQNKLEAIQNSKAYRFGKLILFPLAKVKSIIIQVKSFFD